MEKHIPVLLKETLDGLAVRRGGRYVDGTLGRAGHTREILERGGEVLGIDRDDAAVEEVGEWKAQVGELGRRLTIARGNHGDLERIANENGWTEVDGVLLDLGVSSPQLDEAGRGFSFLREGPLDMRMDRSGGLTAADLVNGTDAPGLERIFRRWGEEAQAGRIAKAICRETGAGRRFSTTTELADFIEGLVGRRNGRHPATRVFQALRMAVNDEEGELERALAGGLALLKAGGRFAVITFESITDRIVKRYFAAHAGRMRSLQQGGEEWEGELPRVRLVTRGVVVAQETETEANPRSRSAKLRVVERA